VPSPAIALAQDSVDRFVLSAASSLTTGLDAHSSPKLEPIGEFEVVPLNQVCGVSQRSGRYFHL